MGFFSDAWESVKDVGSDIWDATYAPVFDPIVDVAEDVVPSEIYDPVSDLAEWGYTTPEGWGTAATMGLMGPFWGAGAAGAGAGAGGAGMSLPSGVDPSLFSPLTAESAGLTTPFWQGGTTLGGGGSSMSNIGNILSFLPGFGEGFGGDILGQGMTGLGNILGIGGEGQNQLGQLLSMLGGGGGGAGGGGGGGGYGAGQYTPTNYPTAQQLIAEASGFGTSQFPQAYGAREQALQDVTDPAYYQSFQPTSFEQALGNQAFANVWPGVQRELKHGLSLSGMADSPVLGRELGRARGELGVDIGTQLANLSQQRANLGITSRMIDPMSSLINPYANLGRGQGNLRAQEKAKVTMADETQQAAGTGLLSNLLGGGLGYLLGGDFQSALQGAGMAGTLSPLWGGQSPYGYGDYQSNAQNQQINQLLQQYLTQANLQGTKVPEPVFNFPQPISQFGFNP